MLISFPSFAGFNMASDGLCFTNGTPELRRFGPLGKLGDKKGICQGMSGIVSAFHENAQFAPREAKLSPAKAAQVLANLRRLHSGDCNKRIKISGYANLQEFCGDHRDLLMKNAIQYNADIAVREISWKLTEFLYYKDSKITSDSERQKLHNNIQSMRKELGRGRWPLLLYYSHVVGVFSAVERNGGVTFGIYDSNYSHTIEIHVPYDWDGLPMAGQKMLWDLSPRRATTICW